MAIPTAAAPTDRLVSWCLLSSRGKILDAEDPARPFYAASTIKLHVLAAVLRAADAGRLDLTGTVPATRAFTGHDGEEFTLAGDHLDETHPPDGHPIALDELAIRMIDRSSNEATNHLIELLGLDAVAAEIDRLRLVATRVERLIGDASALEEELTNETCAGDLARTVRALVRGRGYSVRSRDLARHALRAQRIPIIAPVLRRSAPWGSKSGWVDGYRHDVIVVGRPRRREARYLAIMTSGMERGEADEGIRTIARQLLPRHCRRA